MIDFTNCNIELVSIHHIGNKTNGEHLILSKDVINIDDKRLREILLKYFISPFPTSEFYKFTFSNNDFKLNPLFNYSLQTFSNKDSFHLTSINLAKHLFENSVHPQIKSGDLFVVYFRDILLENEQIDAIGLFKSENRQPFLKLNNESDEFIIQYDDGINIEKMDKACYIFNTEGDNGYKICMFDKSNKSFEAQYWKDRFLQIIPCNDEYHMTKDFMTFTKSFVTKHLPKELEVGHTEKIDLLNRSVAYFKSHDLFEKEEFEKTVLNDNKIIKAFQNFASTYTSDHGLSDNFEISSQAVKKQVKVFKSVLKLDKNFHIYIHGDKNLIERGVENDGRRFYKIYYEKEE
jgi:hypothetical protein